MRTNLEQQFDAEFSKESENQGLEAIGWLLTEIQPIWWFLGCSFNFRTTQKIFFTTHIQILKHVFYSVFDEDSEYLTFIWIGQVLTKSVFFLEILQASIQIFLFQVLYIRSAEDGSWSSFWRGFQKTRFRLIWLSIGEVD